MNRILLFGASALALALGSLAWSPQDTAKPPSRIDELAWLAGGWVMQDFSTTYEEHWISPKGGLMLGCGRTITDGKAHDFEFLRIEERENGDVFYVAQPGGRPPTEFKLVASSDDVAWIFENPQHDFPRRISYARDGDVAFTAIVSGESKAIEFRFERIVK